MIPASVYTLVQKRAQEIPSVRTSVWETATPPTFALKPNDSVSLRMSLVPFKLLLQRWSSEWVSLWTVPLRKAPGTPAALHLIQPQSSLFFLAHGCGDFSSRHWCSKLGSMVWSREPSLLTGDLHNWDISPNSQPSHMSAGPVHFPSLGLLSVSRQLLLYSLNYRTTVQLNLMWLYWWLFYSCNFDGAVRGGWDSIDLLHRLDQNCKIDIVSTYVKTKKH